MKKQTKKTAATPAKPTANAETVAPVRVRDIGKNFPPALESAARALRAQFQRAVDATRPLRSATPEEGAKPARPVAGDRLRHALGLPAADGTPPPPEPRTPEEDLAGEWLEGAMNGEIPDQFPMLAECFGFMKKEAEDRAEIVRKVAGWIRGDATPPDGATRADVTFRGLSWEGWEWNLRGFTVSLDLLKSEERLALGWWNALRRWEGRLKDLQKWMRENLLSYESFVREHPEPSFEIPSLKRAREAAWEFIGALNGEREAWKECAAAGMEAQKTLPADELAAAKARLDGSGALDALEGLRAELRGVAEGVANLAADKRKTSKARRDAGRKGGEESARQRADGERERILAAALERMRRGIAAGKSIKQAARDAMRKGEPLLKSNGEPLREDSLVRYFKAAKSKGGA